MNKPIIPAKLVLKLVRNKSNGQINFSLPKKQLPKSITKHNSKILKMEIENYKFLTG